MAIVVVKTVIAFSAGLIAGAVGLGWILEGARDYKEFNEVWNEVLHEHSRWASMN